MKLTELTGKTALAEIERQIDDLRLRIHELEQKKVKTSEVKPYLFGFEEFWQSYPKKRGKGYAERCWAKIKPDKELLDKMLSSIKDAKRCEEWKKDGGAFIPHPSSWLNAKGWESEYKPMPTVQQPKPEPRKVVTREVDLEVEKKLAIFKNLPEEEQKRRQKEARDFYRNNWVFENSSEATQKIFLKNKILENL